MKSVLLFSLMFILSGNGQNLPEAANQMAPLNVLKNVSSFAFHAGVGVFYGLDEKDEIRYVIITDINERDRITFVNTFSGGKKTTALNVQIGNKTTVESLSEQECLQLKNNKISRFQMSKKLTQRELFDILKNGKSLDDIIKALK